MNLRKVKFGPFPGRGYFHCFSVEDGKTVAVIEFENGRVEFLPKHQIDTMKFVKKFRHDPSWIERIGNWIGRRMPA